MRSKRALYNIIGNLMLQIITIICGFIVPRLIIGHYGSDVNGLLSSITQFLSYITLLEAGVGGVVRSVLYKPLAKRNKAQISVILKTASNFFKKIAFFFIIYLLAVAFIYPFIVAEQFDYFFTFSLVLVIGISTIAQYLFGITYQLLLHADQKQYIYSIVQSISLIINALVIVALIAFNCSIIVVKLASAIVFVLRPLIIQYYVKKKYHIDSSCAEDKKLLEKKYDGLAQHIAYFLHTNTDVVVITLFLNIKEVSVYSVYYMVASGVRQVVNTFTVGSEAVFGNMLANDEKENLSKKFGMVDTFSTIISSVFFTTALVTIESFIAIYTAGVTDADYQRPLLGTFLLLAELVYCIRMPYNSIIVGAGHFKETKKSAYLEAGINIVLSVALVNVFGVYGVALATLVAMLYRTIYNIIYLSKHIVHREAWLGIKKFFVLIVSSLISIGICQLIQNGFEITNYINWAIFAAVSFVVTAIVSLIISYPCYRTEFKLMSATMKNLTHKRRKSE